MIEEKIIIGEGTEWPLNGLLTLPDEAGEGTAQVPGLVLVHGSGPQDMNETIYKNTPFKDIAEALAAKGIAAIRYDKRTKVHGRKMMKHPEDITVQTETIDDAILAAELLRKDTRIGKVFILGHSMGGMLAPRIDAEGGDFDGLIIAAGSMRTLREIMNDQIQDFLPKYKGLVKVIVKRQIKKIETNFPKIDSMTDEEAKQAKSMGGARAYYFKEMDKYPLEERLKSMTKPVFIFQGDKDFQIYPDKDFEGYRKLLEGKPSVKLKLYPGLNHIFTNSYETGTLKDYKVKGRVDGQVTDDIAEWIHAQK